MNYFKSRISWICFIVFSILLVHCKSENQETVASETTNKSRVKGNVLVREDYGTTPAGEKVEQYTLRNEKGMEVKIISYGGRISVLKVPDKNGQYEDVVLGFDSLKYYTGDNPFLGAIIGRYGNRIAKGKFSLDGEEYILKQNNGENHLHGGERGFDRVVWKAEEAESDQSTLVLKYTSKDMEEGYPGNLQTTVTYSVKDDNSLDVQYEAVTDKKTIVNLTQHSHFNLSGDFSKTILDHRVFINADKYLPINENQIPTGEIVSVADTPFDFRKVKAIGKNIEEQNEQLRRGSGYDHCWVLNGQEGIMKFASSAFHPESGRSLKVYTTEPGLQLYTGNFFNGTLPRQGGEGNYEKRSGFCFETQHYPDSPNKKGFPSVVLEPGEKYSSMTKFRFSIENKK